MLKRMFALSNQGLRDLNKGIAATTLSNLCLIAPVSLLVMVIWELLNVISGQESSMRDHAALFICGTVVMFIIVFLTQWLQYNKGVCVYTQRLYEGYDKLYHQTSGRDVYGRSDC